MSTLQSISPEWSGRSAGERIERVRLNPRRGDGTILPVAMTMVPFGAGDGAFVLMRPGVLAETGLDPALLCLEITESVLMNDADFFIEALLGLKMLGVRIAIDDFGTGYSSLAYLRRYPIDVIKIDKGFVDALGNDDSRGEAVVAAIVDLAPALELETVAEGVETVPQLRILERLGCEAAQGYLFARPLAAEVVTELLLAGPSVVSR